MTNFRNGQRVEKAVARSAFHDRMLQRLRPLPGVNLVGATDGLPYSSLQYERSKADLSVKGRADEELKFMATLAVA